MEICWKELWDTRMHVMRKEKFFLHLARFKTMILIWHFTSCRLQNVDWPNLCLRDWSYWALNPTDLQYNIECTLAYQNFLPIPSMRGPFRTESHSLRDYLHMFYSPGLNPKNLWCFMSNLAWRKFQQVELLISIALVHLLPFIPFSSHHSSKSFEKLRPPLKASENLPKAPIKIVWYLKAKLVYKICDTRLAASCVKIKAP